MNCVTLISLSSIKFFFFKNAFSIAVLSVFADERVIATTDNKKRNIDGDIKPSIEKNNIPGHPCQVKTLFFVNYGMIC